KGSELWGLPITGERTPFRVVQSSVDNMEGQFSPDGRWLAYASNLTGRYEIYIQPFPEPSTKWKVSAAGGTRPRCRPPGTELFDVAQDSQLMAVPIRVTSDRRAVDAGVPVTLFPTRLASGGYIVPAGATARPQYAVARDGRFLMNVTVDETVPSLITLVL